MDMFENVACDNCNLVLDDVTPMGEDGSEIDSLVETFGLRDGEPCVGFHLECPNCGEQKEYRIPATRVR